jgi:arginine decarboxylase
MLVSGCGVDDSPLVSFDKALFDAGVANYNIVKVSSILPPKCNKVSSISAPLGSILFTAFASNKTSGEGLISSAVCVGIPEDENEVGVIMEYSCNESASIAEKKVKDMVARSMKLRNLSISDMPSISIEIMASNGIYTTTFSALIMW